MFFNKCISAGWLSVAFVLTFLQGPASSKPEESFISPDGRFAFRFPNSLVRCERDSKQADRWIPAESCEAYTPVCSDFSASRGTTIACVAYLAGGMKGTNFRGASLVSLNQLGR